MTWRKDIDPTIKTHLEALIKETAKDKQALEQSRRPEIAQLWLALATLSKQNFDLRLKQKYIESALKDFLKSKKKTKITKKEQKQIDDILKSLTKF